MQDALSGAAKEVIVELIPMAEEQHRLVDMKEEGGVARCF